MIEAYKDADAMITIEGKEYALYKRGPRKKYPYMVDVFTGEIPQRKQRTLLKSYLRMNEVDVEAFGEQITHWYVKEAIKVAQGKNSETERKSARSSSDISRKAYLPLTEENIEMVHQQVLATSNYGANAALIHDVLTRFPQNVDRELVAMKVALIDLTNSTHISTHIKKISLSEIVDLILNIRDFDVRVAQGDPLLVSQLAKSNGKINLFSFASKYCTYHNVEVYERDDYSIFDRVVKDALPYYIPTLKKSTIGEWRLTFNYTAFHDCIENLLNQKNICVPFRRRKLDHFLWYLNR